MASCPALMYISWGQEGRFLFQKPWAMYGHGGPSQRKFSVSVKEFCGGINRSSSCSAMCTDFRTICWRGLNVSWDNLQIMSSIGLFYLEAKFLKRYWTYLNVADAEEVMLQQ